MKVLHITTHMNVGGIANYILTLSTAIKRRGADVIVLSSGGDLVGKLRENNLKHIRIDIDTKSELSPKIPFAVFHLIKIINEEKVDVVHAHSRVSQCVAFFACKFTKTHYVTTCHGYFKKRFRGIFDTWGERVVAISDAVKMHLEKDLSVRSSRIALVYSGVDIARFSGSSRESDITVLRDSLNLKGGIVVGSIGRLSPVKGQKYLIEAMNYAIQVLPDLECVIVGSGPDESSLKELVKKLEIERSVHFVKSVLDTKDVLSIMEIFVFPSIKEGLGIALLEALARGTPSIASNVGGIGDIIKDGENGMLVPAEDAKSLSEAIVRLAGRADLRREFSIKGRSVVEARFSIDGMADKIMSVYNDILSSR